MNLQLLAGILGLFGAVLLIVALRRLRRLRLVSGGGAFLFSAAFLSTAGLLFVVATNLRTYARLTYEAPVAELLFEARGPQRFHVTLTRLPRGEMQSFDMNGDEWQMDARVLKWKGWANVLGLDALFRLERLSGRYRDIEAERTAPRTVYGLADNPGWDVWSWALNHPNWLPFVDTSYGSATYLPMAQGARYRVAVSQTGLLARPLNAAADLATQNWATQDSSNR